MKHILAICLTLLSAANARADVVTQWPSAVTGTSLNAVVRIPERPARAADGSVPTIVYLKGLPIPRLGQEPDEPILRDLVQEGNLLLILDYAHDERAISPAINADMLKLRQDIGGKVKSLLADQKVDLNRLFILIEGYRLKRDVEFARDGSRTLAMDVQYPSQPTHPVSTLMEITCDNANRM